VPFLCICELLGAISKNVRSQVTERVSQFIPIPVLLWFVGLHVLPVCVPGESIGRRQCSVFV
jgi:hypothetical protein